MRTDESKSVLSEEHRKMIAEAVATMHRFSPEPRLKNNQTHYEGANTVRAIQHAKSKRTRRP